MGDYLLAVNYHGI